MSNSLESRPTIVRHFVVALAMLMAVLLYLDRFCVSMAEPYIRQDLGLNTFQISLFMSAFFFSYALGQVPSGWLSDRFGARRMLTGYIVVWSLFTAMMGLSNGFIMLLITRAAYGLGQAGAYPTSASILSKWVPFSNRGTASSIVAFGGRMGGAIAPILTALLIVMFVPIRQPSVLKLDMIRDGSAICIQLSPEKPGKELETTPLQYIRSRLQRPTQKRIDRLAEKNRPHDQKRKELEEKAKNLQKRFRWIAAWKITREIENLAVEISAADQKMLLDDFNALIESDDFYQENTFEELRSLDRAALKFLKRKKSGKQLSKTETRRFHRLLLEGCFPDQLGKVYIAGWRPVMITYGIVGFLVAGGFWLVIRNRPDQHPRCNQQELALIAAGRPAEAPGPHGSVGRVPWKALLSSRSMWLNCIAQVGTNIGWMFLATWFPRYLFEQYHVPILERGLMASIPWMLGWLGMLGGGRLTDALVRRVGLRWGRRIPWAFSRFIGVAAFLTCPFLDNPWLVTIAMAAVAFSTDLGTASGWSFCQDVGGKYVGSILGWGNMWGNLGAAISPILLSFVFTNFSWDAMFFVCAGSFLMAGLLTLGIDATIPIAPSDDEDQQDTS